MRSGLGAADLFLAVDGMFFFLSFFSPVLFMFTGGLQKTVSFLLPCQEWRCFSAPPPPPPPFLFFSFRGTHFCSVFLFFFSSFLFSFSGVPRNSVWGYKGEEMDILGNWPPCHG